MLSTSLATAIYPTLALLNHSCDPNIAKYFDGKTVFVVAAKKISKGMLRVNNLHYPS